jgi:aspartyl-tRNA(Asn)/glutamyl-tRNA(Gln) amidotransferase subunit A
VTAAKIAEEVRQGRLGAEAAVRSCLDRIRQRDTDIHAFLEVLEGPALESARGVDRKLARGEPVGRLAGVPVAVKDNILVRGAAMTCASKILEGYRAPYDAAAVERLKAEDAVVVGKTNLDEFAMGSSTENSAYGPTRNPRAQGRVPGGSSGGSAAAVAAGMTPLALGSDTGGSVRQPAAFCGVVGLKPTYGSVSRRGLAAFASSLDQIGPLAATVEDAALCLEVLSAPDPGDSTCSRRKRPQLLAALAGDIRGLRVGIPREYFAQGLDPEVESAVRAAAQALRRLGAQIVDLSLPHTKPALSAYYILAPSEASANLARFDGVRYGRRAGVRGLGGLYAASRGEGFGPEVKRRVMLGTYALSAGYYEAYYLTARSVRALVRQDFESAFKEADLLLTPTAPTPAFRLGEKADPLQMYLSDVYTVPCSLAGLPGISLPCGVTRMGLPIGLQFIGRPYEEALLLRAAKRYEEAAEVRLS